MSVEDISRVLFSRLESVRKNILKVSVYKYIYKNILHTESNILKLSVCKNIYKNILKPAGLVHLGLARVQTYPTR